MTNKRTTPQTTYEAHLEQVYSDPEFIKEVAVLREVEKRSRIANREAKIAEYTQHLTSKYAITPHDLFVYRTGQIIYLGQDNPRAKLDTDLVGGEYAIRFKPHATRAEVLAEWEKFQNLRKKLFPQVISKRKPPERPELVYAIFKNRQDGLTFRQIHELYDAQELPYYTGNYSRKFLYHKILERYYDKYRPTA